MDSCSKIEHPANNPAKGYLEGYYGKLLSWSDRHDLLECMMSLQLNTYCYAPKEDPSHRLHWRKEYDADWRNSFQGFCTKAQACKVSVLAGIAPGLDFNFDHFGSDSDFENLLGKARQLKDDGASDILVLWDDIDDKFPANAQQLNEGTAHARVINELSLRLDCPIWTVPRVYADEIEDNDRYLSSFFTELDRKHPVLLCGKAIVVSQVSTAELVASATPDKDGSAHRLILWDNFYANDYCPRRLFVGPWTGRDEVTEFLLNPTGMPWTDKLLLEIASSQQNNSDDPGSWKAILKNHGVPKAFSTIAPYFNAPTFGDQVRLENLEASTEIHEAIEHCLWRWKSPLAREWYPFIMSLKHDLALKKNELPEDRVIKTQSQPLAARLLN